jgi:hypothetical protein
MKLERIAPMKELYPTHHTTHYKNPIKHSTASKIHAQAEDYIWTSKKYKAIDFFCEEWPPKRFCWV